MAPAGGRAEFCGQRATLYGSRPRPVCRFETHSMSLNRILKHVRNSWRTLAICAVAGLVLGGLVTLIQEPTYEATSTVLVSPNGLGNVGPSLGADAYFVAQRAQSYVEVATAPQVLKPAADKAGLDELTEGQVTVTWLTSAPANIDIAVTAPTARGARLPPTPWPSDLPSSLPVSSNRAMAATRRSGSVSPVPRPRQVSR